MSLFLFVLLFVNCLGVAFSQYFPPPVRDVTVVKSKVRKGASISFKEVRSIHQAPGGSFLLRLLELKIYASF